METLEEKNNLKRQRINVITFVILALLCLITLVYAFVQQEIAKENQKLVISQNEELVKCGQDLERYKKIAEASAEEAKLQHQRAEEALKKNSKK